MSEIALDQKQ